MYFGNNCRTLFDALVACCAFEVPPHSATTATQEKFHRVGSGDNCLIPRCPVPFDHKCALRIAPASFAAIL